MGNLTTIGGIIGEAKSGLNEFIDDNKTVLGYLGAGVGGLAIGGAVGYLAGKKSAKKKRTSSSKNKRQKNRRSGSGRARDRRYISKQKHEQYYLKAHPKRRKTGRYYKSGSRSGKVKYTKNGQPYIILKSGKARFIKK